MYFSLKPKHQNELKLGLNDHPLCQTQCTKFLGVHITSNLDWDEHIKYLIKKLSSTCYLLRVIRSSVSPNVLLSLYYGLFYAHIAPSIIFWGSSPTSIKPFRLQKKAVRLMTFASYNTPCRPIFKKLHILPLPCIYIYFLALYIKTNHSDFLKNSDVHEHLTRSHDALHHDYVRTKSASQGPKTLGLRLYNRLPSFVRDSKSICTFKLRLKMFLLGKSYYSLDEYFQDN
jgi:hypothetical protein